MGRICVWMFLRVRSLTAQTSSSGIAMVKRSRNGFGVLMGELLAAKTTRCALTSQVAMYTKMGICRYGNATNTWDSIGNMIHKAWQYTHTQPVNQCAWMWRVGGGSKAVG